MKYYKSKPKIVFAPKREYLDTGNVFALTAKWFIIGTVKKKENANAIH